MYIEIPKHPCKWDLIEKHSIVLVILSFSHDLSNGLSYDIIKAHGGKIRVQTKEGEGSEFVVTLSG